MEATKWAISKSQNRKQSSQGLSEYAEIYPEIELPPSQNRKRPSQGRVFDFRLKPFDLRLMESQNRKRSSQGLSLFILRLKILPISMVTKPQAVITRSEGRAGNPHHRRLKKAFLKNKQTFFCRINKIRLHTMT